MITYESIVLQVLLMEVFCLVMDHMGVADVEKGERKLWGVSVRSSYLHMLRV